MVRCQCEGITRRGVRCSRTVSNGTRCFQHLIVEQPPVVVVQPNVIQPRVVIPTDPVEHAEKVKYVKHKSHWPDMSEIILSPHYTYTHNMTGFLISIHEFTGRGQLWIEPVSKENQCKYIIFICELSRLNKHLYNDFKYKFYDTVLNKLKECTTNIDEYIDCFQETLDPVYRENKKRLIAKKKYIEFIFTHSDLGPLIAQKISQFYN